MAILVGGEIQQIWSKIFDSDGDFAGGTSSIWAKFMGGPKPIGCEPLKDFLNQCDAACRDLYGKTTKIH